MTCPAYTCTSLPPTTDVVATTTTVGSPSTTIPGTLPVTGGGLDLAVPAAVLLAAGAAAWAGSKLGARR